MKTLIVPDIHTHWERADALLQKVPFDNAVLLGDYFDEFYDTVEQNRRTAEWVKSMLANPLVTCLIGNHDYAYWKGVWCSGVTEEKSDAIKEVLSDSDFEKMRVVKVVHGWELSHAGMDQRWKPSDGLWDMRGPLWVRPFDFVPVPNNQIFGHTEFHRPREYGTIPGGVPGPRQVCIDTRRKHYALLEDGALTINEWKDDSDV